MTFQCLETYCCRALRSPTALRSRLVDGGPYSRGERVDAGHAVCAADCSGETYAATVEVVKRQAGAYGMGVVWAQLMISADAAG
ncbi:hypothetical protein ACH492_00160 [Streptomyces sp. NPDC019443]|uniref:hypothetical protein n=1 Tax=Streptomyces sp. NPDC019443 TaxID=3365061 RepID=UPI00378E5A80